MTTFTEVQFHKIAELAHETNSGEIWALYHGARVGLDTFDLTLSVLADFANHQKAMHDRLLDMSNRYIDPVIITVPPGTFGKMSTEPGSIHFTEQPRPLPNVKPWYELFDWGGLFMLVTGIAVGLFMGYHFFH